MDLFGGKTALLAGDEMLKRRPSDTNMATEDKKKTTIPNPNHCRKMIPRINRQTKQLLLNLQSI